MSSAKYHNHFPPKELRWDRIVPLLSKTAAAIARYDSTLELIHNTEVLLSPLARKEAEMSSRIEGTQATMAEVLQYEAHGDTIELSEGKKQDIFEVINYNTAMTNAANDMKRFPICNRVVLKAHKTLMAGVRGRDKAPGKYRMAANWIGPPGCTEEQADYVPPAAPEVPALMSRWEKYINGDEQDILVQLALLHVEFEAIHPFLDGNGRLGRMLIPLYMFQKKIIRSPSFYISAYLEAHRDEYYERLRAVSRDGDWTGWCIFFLNALRAQADNNLEKAKRIIALYDDHKRRIPQLTHSQHGITVLDAIFTRPIFALAISR